MSATPPEASNEYSRGSARPGRVSGAPERVYASRFGAGQHSPFGVIGIWILVGGVLGALLLFVAEFTTLFHVNAATATSSTLLKSVTTGSHHAYALIPIALLTAVLALASYRLGSRPALLAIGVLGIATLLIALVGDLPDAHASGLVGSSASHYVDASATPGTGLYLETLGAAVLIITCGAGFLLLGAPGRAGGRGRGAGGGGDSGPSGAATSAS